MGLRFIDYVLGFDMSAIISQSLLNWHYAGRENMNISEKDGAVSFDVRVVPLSSRSEIVGRHDDALKIRLTSPPVDGAANAELIKLLVRYFAVAKSDVEIINGETSKNKRIKIKNLSKSKFEELIK